MNTAAKRSVVLCRKGPTVEVVFNTYETTAEAEIVVRRLEAIGCRARVAGAREGDCPGRTRARQRVAPA